MKNLSLTRVATALMTGGKGILAMDESNSTCNRRFSQAGLAQTVEMRRAYRELLVTTPELGRFISGAILSTETLSQVTDDGIPFAHLLEAAGILVGVKVDAGAKALAGHAGETVTEGLDGLRERLADYVAQGAHFAKWRAVIHPAPSGQPRPSATCVHVNAHALARYAALCQEAGLVPIVEPEVLMDGAHTLARCAQVTEHLLRHVFQELAQQGVALEAMILKPNMVVAGMACPTRHTPDEVAQATVQCLRRTVPAAVAGIAFLSGGQSGEHACSHLNAMHQLFGPTSAHPLPWPLSFSFGRALQYPAFDIWAGLPANREAAQTALLHRAQCSGAASSGAYATAMEA